MLAYFSLFLPSCSFFQAQSVFFCFFSLSRCFLSFRALPLLAPFFRPEPLLVHETPPVPPLPVFLRNFSHSANAIRVVEFAMRIIQGLEDFNAKNGLDVHVRVGVDSGAYFSVISQQLALQDKRNEASSTRERGERDLLPTEGEGGGKCRRFPDHRLPGQGP